MTNLPLDQRKCQILSAIVSAYIETGEPVGSKALIGREQMSVSSATVRNEMSELERMGYLKKTHTSSGRIPSALGYRYYVSTLKPYLLTPEDRDTLNSAFRNTSGPADLIEKTTRGLATFSGCTVFGVSPHRTDGTFRFEVVPVGKQTVAVLLVAADGTVCTDFFRTRSETRSDDCRTAAKVLNETLSGIPADKIGPIRMILLENTLKQVCPTYAGIAETVRNLLAQAKKYELHIGGSENLLNYPEFSDIETARGLIGMLSRHEQVLSALLANPPSDPIEIRIGMDNGLLNSPHASLITLFCDNKYPVLLGLMGPTRMDYARTIAGCNHLLTNLKNFIEREY